MESTYDGNNQYMLLGCELDFVVHQQIEIKR